MALFFGHALPYMAAHNNGNLYADLVPADERVEAVSGTQELAGGCLDGRVVNLRSQVLEQLNTNLLFNSSMAGATGSVLPTNWASGSVSGLTYKISSASTVQGLRSIEWTVSGTALSDGDLWLACEPMVSGSVVAQIPSEYVGSMYCAKVSGTIKAGMVLQTLTQNFINGAVQETKTKDLAAVTGQTFVRIEPNSVKTDVDLENRVNLRLYQSIASGEVIDFTIRVAAPQVEAGVTASPFISTVSGAVSEVRGRPSILVVPQLTKAGTLYPQLPTVSGADFTVSRNTTATRVNSSGLIESVASGVPRMDWLGQSCPALMVEPSATNLCRYSEQFNTVTSGWSAAALQPITGNTNATLDPAGGNTADLIVATTASGTGHKIFSNTNNFPSFVSGTSYTFSVFAKATSVASGFVQLLLGGNTFSPESPFANFQLSGNGSITTGTYSAASIQSFGNGWYRCSMTATAAASGTSYAAVIAPILASGTTRDGNFTGNGVDGVYLWGTQLEVGSVATTYIPTTTAAVSRAADVISASGALVSGLIGQTEGTIYAEVDLRNWIASGRILTCSNGTSDERIMIQVGANRTLQAIVTTASADVANISTASGQVNGVYKCALTYASGDFAFYVNGTQIGTDSSGGVPACTSVFLGKIGTSASTNFLNDRIRAAALYTTRLSNAQLAELTRL